MSGRLQADRARADKAGERLREIAAPARLQILSLLLAGEHAVAEIEATLGLKQPTLSQHLAALRKSGLVASRRVAKSVFYRLNGEAAQSFVAVLDDLLGADDPGPGPLARATPPPVAPPARRPAGAAVFAETAHRPPLPALRRAASSRTP